MRTIVYHIELLEPALVTSLQGDPNSGVAFDYLPGSVLRGAIVARYMQQHRIARLDETDDHVRNLFLNGCVRYLNGYPLQESARALPVPRSWRRRKEAETLIYDFAVEAGDAAEDWQGVNKSFWLPIGGSVQLIQPERHIAVHIARDRHLGRESDGTVQRAVYRYDALAPGQTFAAAIVCEVDSLAEQLQPLLVGRCFVGGSRSGGYGRARIVHVEEIDEPENWRETGGELPEQESLTLTLLSDALLRDANGQVAVNRETVTAIVAQALGVKGLSCRNAFFAAEPVGGFNRVWGLPLPQAAAVAMGSVFVFDPPDCPPEKLRALEQRGIGERRVEGYGRLAVNWLDEPEWTVEKEKDSRKSYSKPMVITAGSKAAQIASDMAARLLRQKIESLIEQRARELGPHVRGVQRNQLSRLRLVVQDALYQEPGSGRKSLQTYLNGLQKRKITRSQFEAARVGSQPLLSWLTERFSDEEAIWNVLGVQLGQAKIGDIAPNLTPGMAYEYNLKLADAVLARAAKEEGTGS